jgi:hypothetical protein
MLHFPYMPVVIRGCLQYLNAKFWGAERVAELDTNNTFPGQVQQHY